VCAHGGVVGGLSPDGSRLLERTDQARQIGPDEAGQGLLSPHILCRIRCQDFYHQLRTEDEVFDDEMPYIRKTGFIASGAEKT